MPNFGDDHRWEGRRMSRLPERDRRAAAAGTGRIKWRPSNATIAIIFILIFTIGPYLAFTKHVPFTGYGYELNATFSNSANIAKNSPIRIAGVDVGKVIATERDGNNTKVTFTVDDSGQPIHDDAFAAIRPRIFLEGNSSSNSIRAARARRTWTAAARSRSAAPRLRCRLTKCSLLCRRQFGPTSVAGSRATGKALITSRPPRKM